MAKAAGKKNAFYAQSGGVTAVINASACGLIETARQHKDKIGKVYAGRNGIIGALRHRRFTPHAQWRFWLLSLQNEGSGRQQARI